MRLVVALWGACLVACGGETARSTGPAATGDSASCPSPAKPGTTPTLLGHAPSGASIAVDCSTLYVAPYGPGAVTAFSLADGSQRTLNPIASWTIAVDSTRVFSVGAGGGNEPQGLVIACPKTGCAPYTTLATAQTNVYGVAADDTSVYWTNPGQQGVVMKAPLSGGAPTTLVSGDMEGIIAVAGGHVLYAANSPDLYVALSSVPTTGGTPAVLFKSPAGIGGFAVDRDNVYFTINEGLVAQVPLAGGTPVTLATGQWRSVSTLAVDAKYVYWGNSGGNILKTPIGGGAVTTLATGQAPANGVAVDSDNVYWVSMDGTVMMRAK